LDVRPDRVTCDRMRRAARAAALALAVLLPAAATGAEPALKELDEQMFRAYKAATEAATEAVNISVPEVPEDSHVLRAVHAPPLQNHTPGAAYAFEAAVGGQARFTLSQGTLVPFWKRGKKMAESAVNDMEVTLRQAYHGFSQKAHWIRTKVCPVCAGRGALPSDFRPCSQCLGTGALHASHTLSCSRGDRGHGHDDHDDHRDLDHDHHHSHNLRRKHRHTFRQVLDVQCPKCHGRGEELIAGRPHCSRCNGTGIVDEFVNRKVVVPRGVPDGHIIFFEKEGNENLEIAPGDMLVRVSVKEDDVFERVDDNDLLVRVNITLREALLGFQRNVTHLNGTTITVVHDDITTPGQEFSWKHWGMPVIRKGCKGGDVDDCAADQTPHEYGNLIVRVHVSLPSSLMAHQTAAFSSVLGGDDP
jgi:DnaJ-class molecular chaperone